MKKNTVSTLPAFPNQFPWNELLFQGKLSAKTRNWRWKHSGWTLLYTSKSRVVELACDTYFLDPDDYADTLGAIVGIGYLLPVRRNTTLEKRKLESQFVNGAVGHLLYIRAGAYRYEFKPLYRFKEPIKFAFPRGAVTICHVPIQIVEKELKRLKIDITLPLPV